MEAPAIQNSPTRTITKRKTSEQKWNQLLFWFTFFMAFPAIVIVQNISVYIFGAILLFSLRYIKGPVLNFRKPAQWWALLFALGAVISVSNIPPDVASNALERSLAVLPNYIYWSVLVVFMVTHRQLINLDVVYKALFWGVSTAVIYYVLLQDYLSGLPAFVSLSPNGFAFLLVCFAPSAVYYLNQAKGRNWAFIFLFILVVILLVEGRRAGMVLVFLGGLTILFIDRFSWKKLFIALIFFLLFLLGSSNKTIELLIYSTSERIYTMIYETKKIRQEDRSYLTRVAMQRKGIAIFDIYPYTGIGLNNFTNYNIEFDKSFVGSKFVVNKEDVQRTSAHNSYISILSEGGLLLFIPFSLLLINCLFFFISVFFHLPLPYKAIFIGLLFMSIHLYFISAILNVFAWYLIGLSCSLMYKK